MAKRFAVVGAGIIGTCCALALQREGYTVMLFDPAGPGEGASKGNAGVIANNMCLPLATPGILRQVPRMLLDPRAPLVIRWRCLPALMPWLLRFLRSAEPKRMNASAEAMAELLSNALAAYDEQLDHLGMPELIQRKGWLMVYRNAAQFEAARREVDMLRRYGVRAEELTAEEVHAREPALAADVHHAIDFPDCAHTPDPHVLVRRLAEAFTARGGQVVKARITSLDRGVGGQWRLQAASGSQEEADGVVIAAGIDSGDLAKKAGTPLPLESERGYSLTLPVDGHGLQGPLLGGDLRVGITPMESQLRIAGTVELASPDAPPDFRRAETAFSYVRSLLPGLDAEPAGHWMGHRPSLPDSVPVISPAPGSPNVFFAFGHGHLGITTGAVTGRLIADMVAGRQCEMDVHPFRAARF
jgi:D-amino-acid dehydrogenase